MGRLPVVLIALVLFWISFQVIRQGPKQAFGGLFGLLDEPQYGEDARATRSGKLAERHLEPPAPPEDDPDSPWWSEP